MKYKNGKRHHKNGFDQDDMDAIEKQEKNVLKMKRAKCKTDIAIICTIIALGATGM